MSSERITIGELAREADCNLETVRYYEKQGLMPEPPRSEGGHRLYAKEHVKRLTFIRRCRELGFGLDAVRQLLALIDEPHHTCGEVKAITLLQARDVQRKIDDLTRLKRALNDMSAACSGGSYTLDNCPIVQALSQGTGNG